MNDSFTLRLSVNSKTPIKAIHRKNFSEHYNICGGSIDSWQKPQNASFSPSVNSQEHYLFIRVL